MSKRKDYEKEENIIENEVVEDILYHDTLMDSEKLFSPFIKVYARFLEELRDVQNEKDPKIQERKLDRLKLEYTKTYMYVVKSEAGSDVINMYRDILAELSVNDYILDEYQNECMTFAEEEERKNVK